MFSHLCLLTFVTLTFATPLVSVPDRAQSIQEVGQEFLSTPFEYKNGETAPEENTIGWVDPRLNGGRFLDVRRHLFSFIFYLPSRPIVHYEEVGRTTEYNSFLRIRSLHP